MTTFENLKFRIKDGAHISGSAQAIGEELQRISSVYSELRAEYVVEEAQNPANILYSYFEWDDTEAARKFRLEQARSVIRSIEVVMNDPSVHPVRAFIKDPIGVNTGYKPIQGLMENAESKKAILSNAKADLKTWKRRYDHLSEFSKLIPVIDEILV